MLLYCNRLQLAAKDALYSDGNKYQPAIAAISHFKQFFPSVKNVLVLGAGLGSMVTIARQKGYDPYFTLVEQDKVVLSWAMEFLDGNEERIKPVCMDAKMFVAQHTSHYDFIFIDIFDALTVPDFVCTREFLQACKDHMADGGHLAFNFIAANEPQWLRLQRVCDEVFPGYKVVADNINKIIVY